jgi:hypothetical protein
LCPATRHAVYRLSAFSNDVPSTISVVGAGCPISRASLAREVGIFSHRPVRALLTQNLFQIEAAKFLFESRTKKSKAPLLAKRAENGAPGLKSSICISSLLWGYLEHGSIAESAIRRCSVKISCGVAGERGIRNTPSGAVIQRHRDFVTVSRQLE